MLGALIGLECQPLTENVLHESVGAGSVDYAVTGRRAGAPAPLLEPFPLPDLAARLDDFVGLCCATVAGA